MTNRSNRTHRLALTALAGLGSTLLGCASAHPSFVSGDLACAPEDLRSAWWSEGGFFGQGELLVDADASHVLVADDFRAATLRLADGERAEARASRLDLVDVAGVRIAMPRMRADASGAVDLAGATDVFAIGEDAPLASIPWVMSREGGGYTQVIARVGQTHDRVTLLEHGRSTPEATERVFVRRTRVSDPSDEQRFELTDDVVGLPQFWGTAPWFLVDAAHDVAFVGYDVDEGHAARLVRVDLATGARVITNLSLGEPSVVHGRATIGAPELALVDVTLTSDGATIFATTRDGAIREIDARSLEEIGAPRSTTLVVANPDTYLPTLRSPIATSPRGSWLAQLDAEGHVVVVPRDGGAAVALASAAPEVMHDDGSRGPNAMLVRFLADGLLVITDAGVERFRCGE